MSSDQSQTINPNQEVQKNRQLIIDARKRGPLASLAAFVKLSGPGWLQGATTLGGGSLSSGMYLGILTGFSLLWLQPLAMLLGIIMLSSIAYVTLSTGQRPFHAINQHVSPVLGWSWLIASLMANIIWSIPQFSLAIAAIQQNLLKGIVGADVIPDTWSKIIIGTSILIVCVTVVMFYSQGSWGIKLFEIIIKSMVATIVLCFFCVVVTISLKGDLNWGNVFHGFVPNLRLLFSPSEKIVPYISAVAPKWHQFWTDLVVSQQRDVIISGLSTAVGVNMTFLLPYSMLRKGWDVEFRGLAIFDLSTGLFIPFVLATSCVLISSASQFHAVPTKGFIGELDAQGQSIKPPDNLVKPYRKLMKARLEYEIGQEKMKQLGDADKLLKIEKIPEADKIMAAVLVKRDAFNLANALAPVTGKLFSQYVFGFGILGMATGAITMLMLINGFVICEMFNLPASGKPYRIGCLIVSLGLIGVFFWQDAKLYLAIPTSIFALVLLPIAYFAFYFLMNQKSLLHKNMPYGGKRVVWNVLMTISVSVVTIGSLWSLWSRLRWVGIVIFFVFIIFILISHTVYSHRRKTE